MWQNTCIFLQRDSTQSPIGVPNIWYFYNNKILGMWFYVLEGTQIKNTTLTAKQKSPSSHPGLPSTRRWIPDGRRREGVKVTWALGSKSMLSQKWVSCSSKSLQIPPAWILWMMMFTRSSAAGGSWTVQPLNVCSTSKRKRTPWRKSLIVNK